MCMWTSHRPGIMYGTCTVLCGAPVYCEGMASRVPTQTMVWVSTTRAPLTTGSPSPGIKRSEAMMTYDCFFLADADTASSSSLSPVCGVRTWFGLMPMQRKAGASCWMLGRLGGSAIGCKGRVAAAALSVTLRRVISQS
ncbi:hypothetical protein NLG97_g9508 [Lecanicillium saksenae]|uniref:Uncharacterized protein n=1 Tax=Lecanicillium saksenae TaxID=468837 RepID=A0ACC1QGC6_9HYPO|nr:hypothetical protein NLG97_g9508 [Lecanicillium saksenae]